jgi:hypothetical protein
MHNSYAARYWAASKSVYFHPSWRWSRTSMGGCHRFPPLLKQQRLRVPPLFSILNSIILKTDPRPGQGRGPLTPRFHPDWKLKRLPASGTDNGCVRPGFWPGGSGVVFSRPLPGYAHSLRRILSVRSAGLLAPSTPVLIFCNTFLTLRRLLYSIGGQSVNGKAKPKRRPSAAKDKATVPGTNR